jgi:hypothetical protein
MARYYCSGHFLDFGNDALFIVTVSSFIRKLPERPQPETKGEHRRVVGVNAHPRSRRIGWRQLDSAATTAGNLIHAEAGSARWKFMNESLKQLFQFGPNTI